MIKKKRTIDEVIKDAEAGHIKSKFIKINYERGFVPRAASEELYKQNWEIQKELIRRKVINENRVDILAFYVLGYIVAEHHDRMSRFIYRKNSDRALILGPRGGGKTHLCTYSPIVLEILKNPNIRILITSNTQGQAEAFLRVVKGQLQNPLLVDIFGPQKGNKWDTREINVAGRTITSKESTVTCIGLGGGMTSKHFDLVWVEDLVDIEGSRTQTQRDYCYDWFYKTLCNAIEDWTKIYMIGTLYHPDDLYCRVVKQGAEFEHDLLRISALTQSKDAITKDNPEGYVSYWPGRKSVKALLKIKKYSGIHWYTQYQNEVDMEVGEYFQPEWFKPATPPEDLKIYQGVDLAVCRTKKSAAFAHVTIGVTRTTPKHYFLIDAYNGLLTSKRQTEMMVNKFNDYDPIKLGIEGNAYQATKEQDLKNIDEDIRTQLIFTDKDKLTNALKFQPIVEDGRFHIPPHLEWVKDLLTVFPAKEARDIFDAIYIMYRASRKNARKQREKEPGLM